MRCSLRSGAGTTRTLRIYQIGKTGPFHWEVSSYGDPWSQNLGPVEQPSLTSSWGPGGDTASLSLILCLSSVPTWSHWGSLSILAAILVEPRFYPHVLLPGEPISAGLGCMTVRFPPRWVFSWPTSMQFPMEPASHSFSPSSCGFVDCSVDSHSL